MQTWYAKAWAAFGLFLAVPIWYHYQYVTEFRQPMVGHQRNGGLG
jgi:hypothetical protein